MGDVRKLNQCSLAFFLKKWNLECNISAFGRFVHIDMRTNNTERQVWIWVILLGLIQLLLLRKVIDHRK